MFMVQHLINKQLYQKLIIDSRKYYNYHMS